MAFKYSKQNELSVVSDINVTPFIDVMLVLLIIFMVVAPLATVNVPLNLPQTSKVAKPIQDQPIVLSIDADLQLFIDDQKINQSQLEQQLLKLSQGNKDVRIQIRVDKKAPYDQFMQLINRLSQLGFSKVALVSQSVA